MQKTEMVTFKKKGQKKTMKELVLTLESRKGKGWDQTEADRWKSQMAQI